jgi:hypothetical protein
VVVHAVGGWIGLVALTLLGTRRGRVRNGQTVGFAPSNIPMLALGAWILIVGWFGFNVMSAQKLSAISGLVAVNSLMAMVGGTLVALWLGKNDPGFIHNGPLAGLVAVCAGSDLMHPVGALIVGGVAGAIFILVFTWLQRRPKFDDVLGVWPLHGLCGAWGALRRGFRQRSSGGHGWHQLLQSVARHPDRRGDCRRRRLLIYGVMRQTVGLRLTQEEEHNGRGSGHPQDQRHRPRGADLSPLSPTKNGSIAEPFCFANREIRSGTTGCADLAEVGIEETDIGVRLSVAGRNQAAQLIHIQQLVPHEGGIERPFIRFDGAAKHRIHPIVFDPVHQHVGDQAVLALQQGVGQLPPKRS